MLASVVIVMVLSFMVFSCHVLRHIYVVRPTGYS